MSLVMGVLCYARPIHTALTLSFAYANKSANTDMHFFYGIPESGEHKSPALLSMLTRLDEAGFGAMHYLPEDAERNTGGNVDNLMTTLGAMQGYRAYFKVDDDVLIGEGSDEELADLLLSKELDEAKMYVLTGQAVREHMMGPRAFGWDARVAGRTVVCRSKGRSPMETYAAVSYKMLSHLRAHGLKTTCENAPGTFGPYSRKLWDTGAKAGLVLFPHVVMQHIGITCTTGLKDIGEARSWAPAKSWSPAGRVIDVPYFNFRSWEQSHATGTQKEVALESIKALQQHTNSPAITIIIEELEKYTPGVGDVDLPLGRPADKDPTLGIRRRRRVRVMGRTT